MELTKERLTKIASGGGYDSCEIEEMARALLASMEQQPVAYWRKAFRADGFCYADGINAKKYHDAHPPVQLKDGEYWEVTPLYAAPQLPQPAASDGYVLVPVEPTPEMRIAGIESATAAMAVEGECPAVHCYRAMLTAAPQELTSSNIQKLRERLREETAMGARTTIHRFNP